MSFGGGQCRLQQWPSPRPVPVPPPMTIGPPQILALPQECSQSPWHLWVRAPAGPANEITAAPAQMRTKVRAERCQIFMMFSLSSAVVGSARPQGTVRDRAWSQVKGV